VRGGSVRSHAVLVEVARYSIPIALAVMFLAPFLFILSVALMGPGQNLGEQWFPTSVHIENFALVFDRAPMALYFRNSLMYSGLATTFMLLSSVPAAYALSRLRFRFRNAAFMGVMVMMMLPTQVTIVPMYVMWANAGLTGSLWPVILPNLFGDAFSIFLLRQFLLTIPEEYADAARVDGCSEWRIMWQVVLPMARPAVAAVAMFMFFLTWNDFFGPTLYASENSDAWPLALGLASFRSTYQVQWNLTMAATLLVMLPVMVMFFFAQKAFVQGVTLTGVKG
jgi:multiple sugar transport system permease protein